MLIQINRLVRHNFLAPSLAFAVRQYSAQTCFATSLLSAILKRAPSIERTGGKARPHHRALVGAPTFLYSRLPLAPVSCGIHIFALVSICLFQLEFVDYALEALTEAFYQVFARQRM